MLSAIFDNQTLAAIINKKLTTMKLKWTIFFIIIVLWILGGIGLLMNIRSTTTIEIRTLEMIKTSFIILGGLGVILPVYLNTWQSLENNKIYENKIEFDKIENSFKIIEKWDDASLLEARRYTRKIQQERNNISNNDLVTNIESNEKLKESVIMVFNYWEKVRLSIEHSRVDEKMIKEALDTVFIDMYERFKPWIEKGGDDYKKDIEKLFKRWTK
jgi:hypothetical protein